MLFLFPLGLLTTPLNRMNNIREMEEDREDVLYQHNLHTDVHLTVCGLSDR